jgi:hypothetical protein
MAANRASAKAGLLTFGTPDEFLHQTTHQPSARAWAGLTVAEIVDRIGKQCA